MDSKNQTLLDALKDDYESTVGFIYKCDEHIFTIKNWALVTTSAVIAFSISQGQDVIVWVNLVLIMAFMYMELIYKSFQDSAIDHTTELAERIDSLLGVGDAKVDEFKFGYGRKLRYPSIPRIWKVLRNPRRRHILNFYALIGFFSVGAFLFGRFVV